MDKAEENKEKVKVKKKRTLLHRIVNAFLYTGIGLLVLILILFGISQTHTFREFLRETIIEEANSALNGKLYIEEIDGTIFTSLILRNTVINMESDTLLKAESITLMTSPLQLLLKKIYVRTFEIKNSTINLSKDSSGELNLVKLFPPSEEDTTSSEFPFIIQLASLELSNINLSYRNYNISKTVYHNAFNFDDINIKNLYLNVSALLDIKNNIYELGLHHLSLTPNVYGLNLNELSGGFLINKKNISVYKLHIETNRSQAEINLAIKNVNIFDTLGIDMANAGIEFEAGSDYFSFEDIQAIAPSLNMLKGKIGFNINASGNTGELVLNDLRVFLENSNIEGNGKVKNLTEFDDLDLSLDMSGSYIDQNDVKNIVPSLQLPVYSELGIIKFDTLAYNGNLSDFKTDFNISTAKGNVSGLAHLNIKNEPMEYDVTLKTYKLDIEPFAGIKSSLNISAKVNGKGVTPESFDGTFVLSADGSTINGIVIDTFKISTEAKNKQIDYNLLVTSEKTKAEIEGNFDFTNEKEPTYDIVGLIEELNFAEFLHDTTFQTNLNLSFNGEGNSFNQDEIDLFMSMKLFESSLGDNKIDSVRAIIDLRSIEGEERIINIISDIADITAIGNFRMDQATDLILTEMDLVSSAFREKLNKIIPSLNIDEELNKKAGLKIKNSFFAEINSPVNIDYTIELKDFELISSFLGGYNLEIDAEIGGKFNNTSDSVLFNFNTEIDYVKFWNDEEAYFITNMELNLDVSNRFDAVSTSDIKTDLFVSADRIFAGSYFYNLDLNFSMKNDIANINFSIAPELIYAKLISSIDMSGNMLKVSMDTLILDYDKFRIENKDKIEMAYDGNRLEFNNFNLVHNGSEINLKGFISQTGNQDLKLNVTGLKGKDLSVNLMDIKPENSVDADINLNANITGSMAEPRMDFQLIINNINYGDKTFGELKSNFKYDNRNLDIDIIFVDSLLNANDPALTIKGFIPIDLSFTSSEENYIESKPMSINLKSDGFNLAAFGDILPGVNKLRGNFISDLKLTGTPANLNAEGYLKTKDAVFVLEANNLEYDVSFVINIDGGSLKLDSLVLANVKGTKNGGSMHGSGVAVLDNLDITSSKFSIGGDLKVLSEASKSVSPSMYGELVIATDGNVELELGNNRIFLEAPIIVKQANLIFPQTQSAYGSSESYIYHYVEDTITIINEKTDFDRLINRTNTQNGDKKDSIAKAIIFDYDISITIEDEATITFVLSKEFNQNLKAILNGHLRLEKYGSKTDAQGTFALLDGSTLEFIKTLEAAGSITFESELSNPNLDIIATYRGYYYPEEGADGGKEVEVAVKLIIKGPLKDLSKRLIRSEDNIKVYYGADNIEKGNPSGLYDASDAAMFILLDKFNNDANQQDRNAVASTAAGLAGSLVGGFLNKQFGDAIKSVELRQGVSGATKISLSGRAGDFRYEIGTSTDVYTDLSRANIKIEYPVLRRLFLRLERKEAINTQSTYTNEMINEVGIKYRFEF